MIRMGQLAVGIKKKRRKWREHNQKAPEDIPFFHEKMHTLPNWKCSKLLQRKQTITTIQNLYKMEIATPKSERGTKKHDNSPRAKAMQLRNRLSNQIGQKD